MDKIEKQLKDYEAALEAALDYCDEIKLQLEQMKITRKEEYKWVG